MDLYIKEDKRNILVRKRGGGKSYSVAKIAVEKAIVGESVLIVSFNKRICKSVITPTLLFLLDDMQVEYKYVKTAGIILIGDGHIKVIPEERFKEESFKEVYLDDYSYKIYDEACLDLYDFDLIAINGRTV